MKLTSERRLKQLWKRMGPTRGPGVRANNDSQRWSSGHTQHEQISIQASSRACVEAALGNGAELADGIPMETSGNDRSRQRLKGLPLEWQQFHFQPIVNG